MPLEFDLNEIKFAEVAVGLPATKRLTVKNNKDTPIVLEAIIVNSIEFHSSFFESFTVSPKGTTSLEIAFLAREVGRRTATFRIYTSEGIFEIKAEGECVSNPYRLKPFVGHRMPFNGQVYTPINIFNPHRYPMKVTEVSSSGGHAFIELPSNVDEKLGQEPVENWEIHPYQSKHVANVLLLGVHTDSATVFVRISAVLKTPDGEIEVDDVTVTIPIEVTDSKDIFSPTDLLDFGLIRKGERSNAQMLAIYQYKLKESMLDFEALYVGQGDHQGIYMEFASVPPISITPPKNHEFPGDPVDVVKVFFDASKIDLPDGKPMTKVSSGHIIAVSRGGNYNISIPFTATVFNGNMESVGNDLVIQQNIRPPHQRTVRLYNDLPFGVAIWNVSLSPDAQEFFSIRLIDTAIEIGKKERAPAFILKYNKKVPATFDNAFVYVNTNASVYRLSLRTFVGNMKIELTSVEKQRFDFGHVQRNDTRTIRFIVWNPNRAVLTLNNLAVPSKKAYRLYHVGSVKKGTEFLDVTDAERIEFSQARDVDILPEKGAIFDFELKVPQDGRVYEGNMLFETEFESKMFEVTYKVNPGTLQSIPEELSFGVTFPGRVTYRSLQVFNSFDEDMLVTRLTTLSNDPRFYFESFDGSAPPVLRSGRLTNLGRVMFCPQVATDHDFSYLGFPLSSNDGQWFTHSLTLPANLAEVDAYLYKRRAEKFTALVAAGKNYVNTTVVLDTDKAKNIKIRTSAELAWPRLLSPKHVHFPITALGNYTIKNLTLTNPTNMPIVVQVIPLVIYPDAESLVRLFRDILDVPLTSRVEMNETLMFSLRDTELFTLKPDSPVPRLREQLEAHVPTNVPRFTLSMILQPHMKVRLRVGFLPSDDELRSSLLLIRNNLTVLEPVVMYGRGGRLGMKVEGVDARSKQPLLFEIRHDHLTDCNNPKRLMHKLHSTLTVRRPFTVHNSGEVRFTVTNMSINNVPCENRGFRILNCYPFHLEPNESYALDIAYTPDFLTTTNEADLQLYMHMNGSAWLFPLAATVPGDMLAKCHQALPRPPFENIMYYSCVTALIFCLVCVLACAYLEGDRAIAYAIRQQHAIPRTVFDLNNLGKRTDEKVEKPKEVAPDWNSQPSALRAPADAWFVSRLLVNLANHVVHVVHSVWKWSIFARQKVAIVAPDSTKTAPTKKKKKAPIVNYNTEKKKKVTPTNSLPEATNNNNNPPTPQPVKSSPKEKEKKKKPPASPKPPPPPASAPKKGRKKSAEVVRKDPEPEPTTTKPAETPTQQRSRAVSAVPSEKSIPEMEVDPVLAPAAPQIDPELQLAALQQQLIANGMLLPGLMPLPYTYPMMYDPAQLAAMAQYDAGAAVTAQWDPYAAAAAAAAAMNFDLNYSMMAPPPPPPAAPLHPQMPFQEPPAPQPSRPDSASGESDLPDWADEEVDMSGDVDARMSAMVDATQGFFEDEGGRVGRAPSVGSDVSSLGPQPMEVRRRTIGSEMKKGFEKTPGRERAEQQKAQEDPPGWSNLGFPTTTEDPSLSSSMWPSTSFGNTMFAGRDFDLWSDAQYDPSTAWASLTGAKNQQSDHEEKKK